MNVKNKSEKAVAKKSAGEVVSSMLSVLCAIAAVVLVGVTAFALINGDKTPGTVAPEVATTTESVQSTEEPSYGESSTDEYESTEPSESQETKIINPDQKHWYLVVVDRTRQLPESFEPETAYVAESDYELDARVAPYYDAMYEAAYEDGVVLTPYSGYRRYETQANNYNSLVGQYISQGYSQAEAEDMAALEILPAGCSEHNLGLAMDICNIDESFRDSAEYEWLCENAHTYGFVERYPADKQDITGVVAEPWHWRFVGPAHAEAMKTKGITTLEEYLQSYGVEY